MSSNHGRKNGLRAFGVVREVLHGIGWNPVETEYEGVLKIDFSSDQIPISEALAEVRLDYERFIYYLNFADRAEPKWRGATMEFVTRANFDMITGNFELNLDSGLVRFKSSIDFTSSELSGRLVRNVITSAMDVVEHYAEALVSVLEGRKAVEVALRSVEE